MALETTFPDRGRVVIWVAVNFACQPGWAMMPRYLVNILDVSV